MVQLRTLTVATWLAYARNAGNAARAVMGSKSCMASENVCIDVVLCDDVDVDGNWDVAEPGRHGWVKPQYQH
jgi:hypothetical protein